MFPRSQSLILLTLLVGLSSGCQTHNPSSAPISTSAKQSNVETFELNFVGLCVNDSEWSDAHRFYSQRLGMRSRNQNGHWAIFGAGWDAYLLGQSRGLVIELFEGGGSAPSAISLGLQVRDLARTVESATARGVRFLPRTESGAHAAEVRFMGPAGVEWSLREVANARASTDLSEPEITRVELQVADLPGQIAFYQQILGMPRVSPDGAKRVVLRRHSDGPELVLSPGGQRHDVDARWKEDPALGQKVFLGFMAGDVSRAAAQLRAARVRILHEVEHHDWAGTDLIVADADGNAVQVFSQDTDHRFGSARP